MRKERENQRVRERIRELERQREIQRVRETERERESSGFHFPEKKMYRYLLPCPNKMGIGYCCCYICRKN